MYYLGLVFACRVGCGHGHRDDAMQVVSSGVDALDAAGEYDGRDVSDGQLQCCLRGDRHRRHPRAVKLQRSCRVACTVRTR